MKLQLQIMERIKNSEDLEKYLLSKNYSEEETNEFVKMVKPFYDFYDYMLETHNMDYDTVEKDASYFSESVFSDYLKEFSKSEEPMKFMMKISGKVMERYANKYDYTESEKVKLSLNVYTSLLFKSQIKNKGDE